MDWTVYKDFTGVKLPINYYSDACLSNIYALKYALTTQQPDVTPHDALVHECGHSEGTPGQQRVKTINILSPKTIERNEQKQVRAYPYEKSGSLKLEPSGAPVAKAYDATPDFDLPLLGASRDLLTTRLWAMANHLQFRIHWAGVRPNASRIGCVRLLAWAPAQ